MKNYLGECNSKVTRQNGERSEILVSNPVIYLRIATVFALSFSSTGSI